MTVLTTSDGWALALIAMGIAIVLLARFGGTPMRVGNEDDEDDRVLDARSTQAFGTALAVSGLVAFVHWTGWLLVAGACVWAWRKAR